MKKFLLLIIVSLTKQSQAQIITTFAGNGTGSGTGSGFNGYGSYSGNGGQASAAGLFNPGVITKDAQGNLYFSDAGNYVVRKINSLGVITTIAGNGTYGGGCTNGMQATSASLSNLGGTAVDNSGNIYFINGCKVFQINSSGIINAVAGTTPGYGGDGGQATSAFLLYPSFITFDASNNLYISDALNNRIRMVNTAGIITTVVGNGAGANSSSSTHYFSGDGGQATNAEIDYPEGITFDAFGNLYFADMENNRIRKVNSLGIITTIVGGDTASGPSGYGYDTTAYYAGDGGYATAAALDYPSGIAFDAVGNLYIADAGNNVVRKINTLGIIATYVGNGHGAGMGTTGGDYGGYTGDGGLAKSAELYSPASLIFDSGGNMYISDTYNNVIRKVTPPLTVQVNSDTICAGNAATLTATGGNTYSWSPAVGLNTTLGSVVVASPTITTTYTVLGTKGDSMGLALATVTVPVLAINAQAICLGNTTTLTAAFATSCTWSTGETTTSIIITPSVTTTYTVTGIASTCNPAQIAITTVTVNPVPSANLTSAYIDSAGCGLSNGAIYGITYNNVFGGTAPYHFQWYTAGNAILGYATDTLSFVQAGIYTLQITDTNNCIANIVGGSSTFQIPGFAAPVVSFNITQNPTPHVWDLYVDYSADVTNAIWYWGDDSTSTSIYPSHTYDTAGAYNICVTVFNACGDSTNFCQNDSIYRLSHNAVSSSMVHVNVLQNLSGINKIIANSNHVSVYPNPNNGSFIIETNVTEKQSITLYDVNGKIVLSQTINGKTTIDASNLAEGVYNLSIISNDGVVNKRLIIIH